MSMPNMPQGMPAGAGIDLAARRNMQEAKAMELDMRRFMAASALYAELVHDVVLSWVMDPQNQPDKAFLEQAAIGAINTASVLVGVAENNKVRLATREEMQQHEAGQE